MKKDNLYLWHIAALAAGVAAISAVEALLAPPYFVKSAIKVGIFGGLMLLFTYLGYPVVKTCFARPPKKRIKLAAILFLAVFGIIWAAYFVAAPFIDASQITASLMGKEGVTLSSFLPVALYISFVNSLLEECFFRGFGYLTLRKSVSGPFAHIYSALLFSLYHVFILNSWFSLPIFLLITAALVIAGLFFNAMDSKGSVWPSYIVHMAANFGINTVGVLLMMK